MTFEKAKKRGRPAQLLQVAELHGFVEFLRRQERSELQDEVMMFLLKKDFNFELLSEPQQVLVKEALKPYREHLKLQLLFDELVITPGRTEYEEKFLELYQEYKKDDLDPAEMNILKTMCTRYLNFKAQKLEYSDLELYLSQIQKKYAGKKRKAENQRKFEVGGGVLSLYKVKDDENLDSKKFLKRIEIDRFLAGKFRQSKLYKKVWGLERPNTEKYQLLFEVLHQLALYGDKAGNVTYLDFAIEQAQKKLRKESESGN
ncbi:hypothetical protein [Acinetobacter baumannii]|uniref:hypothetical protein n=1 Tax=Acinetobacter baumannii TaxID=470 RepID=UPI003390497E